MYMMLQAWREEYHTTYTFPKNRPSSADLPYCLLLFAKAFQCYHIYDRHTISLSLCVM